MRFGERVQVTSEPLRPKPVTVAVVREPVRAAIRSSPEGLQVAGEEEGDLR